MIPILPCLASGSPHYTIGLVSDTHDVDQPIRVIDGLSRLRCDLNVHLGDIGGSRTVMRAVREFKRRLGKVDHLPEGQRARFLASVEKGTSPLRAYVETVLGPEGLVARVAETSIAYRDVLSRMARLSNPIMVSGNADRMQLTMPHIQACVAKSSVPFVKRPAIVDLGWLGIVLWPSWRPACEEERQELADTVRELTALAAGKEQLVILAHEHFFKGPPAAQYTERVARAGLQQRSVPRFDPNPTWRALMCLLRSLPLDVACLYVFGHVHDGMDVLGAAMPALNDVRGSCLRYRLYGLSWRGQRAKSAGDRRTISMFPVAIDNVAELRIHRLRDIAWRVVHRFGDA